MKKLKLLSFIIAFLLGGIFFPFYCNAQALPNPSANTFSVIEGGNSALSYSAFSTIDVLPINSDPVTLNRIIGVASQNPLVLGAQLNTLGVDDYTIRQLTESEKEEIRNSQYDTFYNANGDIVDLDDIYYMSYINSMFHGKLYIDSSGNILTTDSNNTHLAFQLGLGGQLLGVSDIANIYDEIGSILTNNHYNINLDNLNQIDNDISFYIYGGSITPLRTGIKKQLFDIFIPNVYDLENYYPTQYDETTHRWIIYTNNSNLINYYRNDGGANTYFTFTNQTSTINNRTYNYKLILYDNQPTGTNYISDWENYRFSGDYSNVFYIFQKFGYTYDSSLLNSDIQPFEKIIALPSTKQLQFDDTYDYNYIKELEQSLNNTDSSPNELFDTNESINESNYPLNIEVPSSAPVSSPSELPFPESEPEPEPTPMPDPSIDPSIGSDIGEVDPTELRSTIPVINNLLNRFPFSIPWDIYGLLSGLSVERETPYINTTIHIPGINYDWVLDYDLSDFDGIASLFRTLFLIAFILGLAYFSYDHFFGS